MPLECWIRIKSDCKNTKNYQTAYYLHENYLYHLFPHIYTQKGMSVKHVHDILLSS